MITLNDKVCQTQTSLSGPARNCLLKYFSFARSQLFTYFLIISERLWRVVFFSLNKTTNYALCRLFPIYSLKRTHQTDDDRSMMPIKKIDFSNNAFRLVAASVASVVDCREHIWSIDLKWEQMKNINNIQLWPFHFCRCINGKCQTICWSALLKRMLECITWKKYWNKFPHKMNS